MGSGKSDSRRSARALEQGVQALQGVRAPTVDEQKIYLEQLLKQGEYTPEMEQYLGNMSSELENIDPRLKGAQMSALQQMAGIAESGFTEADAAALNLVRRDVASEGEAKQQQILQEMAQRGMSGSGNELIARLKGAQSAADRLSESGDRQAVEALNRQMNAIQSQGNLAGSVRGQDMSQAQGLDAISQFNQNNQQSLMGRNVGMRNQAQAQNLAESQRLADQNVGMRNQQQQYNTGLKQQQFQNDMQKQQAIANARAGQAQQYAQAAANSSSMTGNLLGTAGAVVGGIYGGPAGAAAGAKVGQAAGGAVS